MFAESLLISICVYQCPSVAYALVFILLTPFNMTIDSGKRTFPIFNKHDKRQVSHPHVNKDARFNNQHKQYPDYVRESSKNYLLKILPYIKKIGSFSLIVEAIE